MPKGSTGLTLLYSVNHLRLYRLVSCTDTTKGFLWPTVKAIETKSRTDLQLQGYREHPWVWWDKSATNHISLSLTA